VGAKIIYYVQNRVRESREGRTTPDSIYSVSQRLRIPITVWDIIFELICNNAILRHLYINSMHTFSLKTFSYVITRFYIYKRKVDKSENKRQLFKKFLTPVLQFLQQGSTRGNYKIGPPERYSTQEEDEKRRRKISLTTAIFRSTQFITKILMFHTILTTYLT